LSSPAVPWQRLLTVNILQVHELKYFFSQPPVQNSTELNVLLLLRSCPLLRERIYQAVAQKLLRRGPQETRSFIVACVYIAVIT
jgi:hypothetical protein